VAPKLVLGKITCVLPRNGAVVRCKAHFSDRSANATPAKDQATLLDAGVIKWSTTSHSCSNAKIAKTLACQRVKCEPRESGQYVEQGSWLVEVAVGTFNLNNLFSRFDFSADLSMALASVKVGEQTTFSFSDPSGFKRRTYLGKLVKGKPAAERTLLANRIKRINLDVLALQEVEDIDTLRQFNRDDLGGLYPEVVLIEGNDPRLIDLGLLSRLPIGAVTSWQHAPDPVNPGQPLFARDLLQVEILNATRSRRLFTVFNNHLKSHYVPFTAADPAAEEQKANELRRRQCEAAAAIIAAQTRPDSRYVVVGDMNDPVDSPFLQPLAQASLNLSFGLANPQETRPGPGNPPPPTAAWTERFKASGKPAVYTLMDQVWLSPALAPRQTGAFIDRRTRLGGDGTDHDAAWVTLQL
jgi:endonuclease/exonuclease/phosphatase family metal-dependent hydrolase